MVRVPVIDAENSCLMTSSPFEREGKIYRWWRGGLHEFRKVLTGGYTPSGKRQQKKCWTEARIRQLWITGLDPACAEDVREHPELLSRSSPYFLR